MSRLDDILEQHKEWLRGIKVDRLIGVGTEPTKQQIKDLILELIGELEQRETFDMGLSSWSSEDLKAFGKNELKIELRQKVEEL